MRILLAVLASMLLSVPAGAATIAPEDLECGEPIGESTTLSRSLFNCPASGIVITADDITLDLGGFTIDGTDAASSRGVDLNGHIRVTVRNGTIRDFDDGISGGGARLTVARVNVLSIPANAIIVPTNSRVLASTVVAAGSAMSLGSESRIAGNRISGSTNGIVQTGGSSGSLVEGNRIQGVTFNPIAVFGDENVVRDNVSEGNLDEGINIGGSSNRVLGNVSRGNATTGILVGGGGNLIKGNRATGNDGNGIFVDSAPQNTLRNNRANNNEGNGIFIDAATAKLFDNVANLNGFADGAANNVGSGIFAADLVGIKGAGNSAKGNDGTDCVPARLC